MNLINNPNWADYAKSQFIIGESILVINEECKVDYSCKTIHGELVGFGYDLIDGDFDFDHISSFLHKDELVNGELSFKSRMRKFYHIEYSPIVFLVSKNKIYYLPNGIRQINPYNWFWADDISVFIDSLLPLKNRLEKKYQDVYTRKQEELHPLNISEIKTKYSEAQINILSKSPLWFEESKHENITSDSDTSAQFKHTKKSLSRLCIQTNSRDSNLKLKIDISEFEHIYGGSDPEEYLVGDVTKYFTINLFGEIKVSNFEQGEIYTLLEI
jgi:hypothetical protein